MQYVAVQEGAVSERKADSAFESLMRDTYKSAYTLAYRLTGNAAEAEDLVQEAFIRAYRFFHRYDDRLPFTSWLYRIMTNAHIDSVRRKGKLKLTPLDSDGGNNWDLPDQNAGPERLMLQDQLEEPMQKGLLAMTSEFRTAVLLADVEGLAYDEVAEIMGTSVGTVRSRIHRGRKQLRNYLVKHAPKTYGGLKREL
jgi:RNA polymerase sigma-70 factor (ECF subfamily)